MINLLKNFVSGSLRLSLKLVKENILVENWRARIGRSK